MYDYGTLEGTNKLMNSIQYEELCRFYIAKKSQISVDMVKSNHVPNPVRPGLPQYKHQIDLYWENENELAKYLNIANAKWRSSEKVDQPDMLLLQQVKQKVGAHKAIMITNTGFTSGAEAVAQDDGIGMHIVVPAFDCSELPKKDREQIQQVLGETQLLGVEIIYRSNTVYKGIDIELIENDDSTEGLDSIDLFLFTCQKMQLGYQWVLSSKGYNVDEKISNLETKIAQIRSKARI